jgi:predicted nucleic acid-binding protein
MRLVLDSSVAIKWVLPEKDTPRAVRLRNEFRLGLHDVLAPDVFPVEISSALPRAERRGVIRPPAAIKRWIGVYGHRTHAGFRQAGSRRGRYYAVSRSAN